MLLDGALLLMECVGLVLHLSGFGVSSVVGAGTLLPIAIVVVRHAELETMQGKPRKCR